MYCPNCGTEVDDDAAYCRHCGVALNDSMDDPDTATDSDGPDDSADRWNPKSPITSVFASIILLWTALHYGRISALLIFGVPAILVIPRVRRRIVPWIREQFNEDPTSTGAMVAVGGLYAILLLMAAASVIGSTANNPNIGGSPTRQVTIGLLTIAIMFAIAVVIVTAIRINRKLQG